MMISSKIRNKGWRWHFNEEIWRTLVKGGYPFKRLGI